MRVVVPFATETPNTRLEPVLTPAERAGFARAMLADVLRAVDATGHQPTVLATGPVEVDVPVTVDDRPLTNAVNTMLAESFADGSEAVAVVMADLALATPAALTRLFSTDGEVVLAPGRGGGTNALVTRQPDFRVDYHGVSIRDHRRAAREVGATVTEIDSMRLAADVDEPADLVEIVLHGDGQAREWLIEAGFEVAVTDGRATIHRSDSA